MAASKQLLGSSVVTRRGYYGSVYSCSSTHFNSSSSWIKRSTVNSEKSILAKEMNGKKSCSAILTVERPKGNAPKAALQTPLITAKGVDVNVLWANLLAALASMHKFPPTTKLSSTLIQMYIEKVIVDSRFFTLLAVAGSLLGSVLCFVEGCIMIMKSYLLYLHTHFQRLDSSGVVQLVIEAIDMFLVGTAMLIFGMGLYAMFVRIQSIDKNEEMAQSAYSSSFKLQVMPTPLKTHSLSQVKSRVGHAIMMILQVGVLEKFKTVSLVTSLDLACFAGAILVSSTSIFLLSKLSSPNLSN